MVTFDKNRRKQTTIRKALSNKLFKVCEGVSEMSGVI